MSEKEDIPFVEAEGHCFNDSWNDRGMLVFAPCILLATQTTPMRICGREEGSDMDSRRETTQALLHRSDEEYLRYIQRGVMWRRKSTSPMLCEAAQYMEITTALHCSQQGLAGWLPTGQ